jgi:hypothetical protein
MFSERKNRPEAGSRVSEKLVFSNVIYLLSFLDASSWPKDDAVKLSWMLNLFFLF